MNDNNGGNGFIGGLILVTGFATLLLLPVILMRKFGVHVMCLFMAIGMTVFAYFQPALINWVSVGLESCSHCQSDQALLNMLTITTGTGSWIVAAILWVIALSILFFGSPATQSEN